YSEQLHTTAFPTRRSSDLAKTREGQLQVELAQLEYMLPRLHGMGLVLSCLGGGIGTRGPGETKLESDQRHIRRRIDDIKRRLMEIGSAHVGDPVTLRARMS